MQFSFDPDFLLFYLQVKIWGWGRFHPERVLGKRTKGIRKKVYITCLWISLQAGLIKHVFVITRNQNAGWRFESWQRGVDWPEWDCQPPACVPDAGTEHFTTSLWFACSCFIRYTSFQVEKLVVPTTWNCLQTWFWHVPDSWLTLWPAPHYLRPLLFYLWRISSCILSIQLPLVINGPKGYFSYDVCQQPL